VVLDLFFVSRVSPISEEWFSGAADLLQFRIQQFLRSGRIEKIMWDVAKHVLEMGGEVILDYGCGRVSSVMITGTGLKSWVQISSCIIWMFRIPNYIAVWKNEIETSLKARLKFPKRKWIDTSLFSNRRPETSLYRASPNR
jgi:hypothetical protein